MGLTQAVKLSGMDELVWRATLNEVIEQKRLQMLQCGAKNNDADAGNQPLG